METLCLNTCLETACGDLNFEALFQRKFSLQILDQDLILRNDQDFGHGLIFQVSQRHSVLFEKLD